MNLGGIWPKFCYDLRNTGYFPYTPNALYISDDTGLMYSIDPINGSINWVYTNIPQSNSTYTSPIIDDDGIIYVGSQANYLFALNSDGNLVWGYTPGNCAILSIVTDDFGNIYFSTGGSTNLNYVQALSSSGNYEWSTTNFGSTFYAFTLTIANNNIYAVYGGNNYNLLGMSTINSSGNVINSYILSETSPPILDGLPAVDQNGFVYVIYNQVIYIFNPDGSLNTSYNEGFGIYGYPVIDSNGIIYAVGNNNVYAFNPDGSIKWTSASTGNVLYGGIALDESRGVLYYGSDDYNLYCVSIENGSQQWVYTTSTNIEAPPVIDGNGVIYIGNGIDDIYTAPSTNYVYAINPDGSLKWEIPSQFSPTYSLYGNFRSQGIALSIPIAMQMPCYSNYRLSIATRMRNCS